MSDMMSRTVLLVEDNHGLREMIAFELAEDHGLTVLEADNLRAARQLADKNNITFILTDLFYPAFPDSSAEYPAGLDLLRMHSTTPRILMSAGITQAATDYCKANNIPTLNKNERQFFQQMHDAVRKLFESPYQLSPGSPLKTLDQK